MIGRSGRSGVVLSIAGLLGVAACAPDGNRAAPASTEPAETTTAPTDAGDPGPVVEETRVGDAAFDRAVAAEGGVVPLVADLTDVGAVDSVIVVRTPDVDVGVWRLLARDDGDRRPLISFEIESDVRVDVRADRVLTDGRPAEIDGDGTDAWIRTIAEQGHSVDVVAPTLDVDEMLSVVDGVVVDGEELVVVPDGWIEAGTVPIPTWLDGHRTDYLLADGRRCSILVERQRGDREALVRFGPTTPVDLATDGWAYRIRPRADQAGGYVFEYGDDLVVNVVGELFDAELRSVIASLRELRPGEAAILEPGTSSSA